MIETLDKDQQCLNCFTRVDVPAGESIRCPECGSWCVSEKKKSEVTITDTLDKIDKLPSGKMLYTADREGGTTYLIPNLDTDKIKTLSTHLRKLMKEDEMVRKILNGEVDPRAEEK